MPAAERIYKLLDVIFLNIEQPFFVSELEWTSFSKTKNIPQLLIGWEKTLVFNGFLVFFFWFYCCFFNLWFNFHMI